MAVRLSALRAVSEGVLQLNLRNIPFVNNVKYLDVIFDRRVKWMLHIERTVSKALGMYMETYSLFRSYGTRIDYIFYKGDVPSIYF
jgi:hypothetical protein